MPPKILNKGDVNKKTMKIRTSMSTASSIIVIAGMADNRTMNKNKRRNRGDEGIRRKHLLKQVKRIRIKSLEHSIKTNGWIRRWFLIRFGRLS